MTLPTLAHPAMLILGCGAALLLLLLFRIRARSRKRRLLRFADPRMAALLTASLSPGRRRIKSVLLALAVLACFTALAGPRLGTEWIEVQQRGIDILIGLDASRSMLAADMAPNRLTRAKLAIHDFVGRLSGDRIGLLPFAGTTFLMCPLTTDYEAFLRSLDAVEPDLLPSQGTDIALVINQARRLLARENNHKILILITDGEDLGGRALAAARAAARDKVTIFTVGVGTSQGELIPDPDRPGTFLKDEQGNVVRSRLDETTLRTIAKITGGIHAPLGKMGEGLMRIYQEKLRLLPEQEHREQKKKIHIERFYWPLAVALFLFIAEFLLGERRGTGATGRTFLAGLTTKRSDNRLTLLILSILLACHPGHANGLTAEQLFHQGQLDKAGQKYQQALAKAPDNPVLHYNLGDVLYRQKQYARAAEEFTRALAGDDLELQARSYFNLGNSHFQMGAAANGQPDKAVAAFRQAVKAYEASLKLHPDDQDARANLALAKKRLQEIQKQQKKKNKPGSEKKEPDQNKQGRGKQEPGKHAPAKKEQQPKTGPRAGQGQREKEQKNSPPRARAGDNKNGQSGGKTGDQAASRRAGDDATQGREDRDETRRQEVRRGTDRAKARQQGQAVMQQAGPGKMSREEARALLESLRDQEGMPVYVPNGPGGPEMQNSKNW